MFERSGIPALWAQPSQPTSLRSFSVCWREMGPFRCLISGWDEPQPCRQVHPYTLQVLTVAEISHCPGYPKIMCWCSQATMFLPSGDDNLGEHNPATSPCPPKWHWTPPPVRGVTTHATDHQPCRKVAAAWLSSFPTPSAALMQHLFSSVCLKDFSLQGEPMKQKKDIEPVESKKQRLASVTSSESFASSGFQEDKSLSDVEEDEEGRY